MPQPANQPKPKEVTLSLPVPTRIGGDTDAMLESTIADKYMTIMLVKNGEKDVEKGQLVLSHKPSEKDKTIQVSTWNTDLGNLIRYLTPLVNAWSSGVGLSGDGSCVYVAKHTDEVLKVVPDIVKRDLYLVPNGRSGVAKYRVSIQTMIDQVKARASVILSCKDTFGIASSKERTRKEESAPTVKLI